MAGIAAGGGAHPGPAANAGRRRAAGIYGAIITAAILDTAGGRLATGALVAAVVITLLVYWLAEEYAELLGEQAAGGRLPGRAYVREAMAATWPMVSASFLPLLVVVLARLAGAVRRVGGGGARAGHGRAQGPGPDSPALTVTGHGWPVRTRCPSPGN